MHRALRLTLVAALLLPTGCRAMRVAFVKSTGEALSVRPDPERRGKFAGHQGEKRIDEESFYRIAGDRDVMERYRRYHGEGRRDRYVGLGVGLGGLTAIVLSPIVLSPIVFSLDTSGDPDERTRVIVATAALLGGGAVCGLVGILLDEFGRRKAMDDDAHLIDDPERMRRAAEEYNRRLPPPPAPAAPAVPPKPP